MYNGQKISDLITAHGIKKNSLCEAIGFTSSSQLRQVISGNPTVKTIEKIADYFCVSIDYFFERTASFDRMETPTVQDDMEGRSSINPYKEELRSAKQLLAEKDKHIASLERMVDILSEELKSRRPKD